MLTTGEFDLAQAELDSVTVPTNSPESMQLVGMCVIVLGWGTAGG